MSIDIVYLTKLLKDCEVITFKDISAFGFSGL